MTCTERCRKAHPGHCCCECAGEHHGEAAPVQQRRLVITMEKPVPSAPECGELERAAAAGYALVMTKDANGVRHLDGCSCFKPFDKDQLAEEFRDAMDSEREAMMGVATAVSKEVWDSVEAIVGRRQAHVRSLDGRKVRLVPGRRYTHDGDSPIWRAHLGGKCASDVDPDRAARKVLEL